MAGPHAPVRAALQTLGSATRSKRGWPSPGPSATWVSDVCGERATAGRGHTGQAKALGTGVSSPSGIRRVAHSCPISWEVCLGQLVGVGTPESPWGAAGGSRRREHLGSRKWGAGRSAELRGAGLRFAPPPPGLRPCPRAVGRVTGGLSFLVLLV